MFPNQQVLQDNCGYDFDNGENLAKWRGIFQSSLEKLLQQVHPTLEAQLDALEYVEKLLFKVLSMLCLKPTPHSIQDVEERIQKMFPNPIDRWAIKEAHSAVEKGKKKCPVTLPAEKVHSLLQKEILMNKVDYQVSLYIMGVLECIGADILNLSGSYVKNIRHIKITVEDVEVAMWADKALMDLFHQDEDVSSVLLEDEPVTGSSLTYDEVVKNLIHEEKQYLRDLHMIIKVFREQIASLVNPSSKELDLIFSNIEDIYELTVTLLGSLEDTLEVTEQDQVLTVGSCFEELAEGAEFDVYERYARDVFSPNCREILNNLLSKREVFQHKLQTAGHGFKEAVKYYMPKLLLGPVYHALQYFDQMKLLHRLSPLEEDKESLEQVEGLLRPLQVELEKMVSSHSANVPKRKPSETGGIRFNSHASRQVALRKVQELQRLVDGFEVKDIGQCCNEFICEGTIGKLGSGKRLTERYVFLFDGLIILCKHNIRRTSVTGPQGEYRLKEKFFIRKVEIVDREDTEELRNAFEIAPRNQPSVVLFARCQEEKNNWMAALVMLNTKSMLERTLDSILREEEKKHPLRLPSPDEYRFAEEDSDSNIVSEMKENSGVPVIKGATLLKLVERLTYHRYADPMFVRTFLTTYRSFCSPQELLDMLIERFDIPDLPLLPDQSEACQRESLKKFRKGYVQPVQFRVLNVLRHWVDHHFYDFERDVTLLEKLQIFLDSVKGKSMRKWVESIIKVYSRRSDRDEPKEITFPYSPPPPEWHLNCPEDEWDLMTLHPIEIARQLTLLEFDLYRAVKPSELVGSVWTKKNKEKTSPNLLRMIHHTTHVTRWFERSIVDATNFEERIAVVSRIIEIMIVLQELNNFNGVLEAVAAMSSASVHRLTLTFQALPQKLEKALEEAKELSSDHFRKYQEKLRSINPPCVPFFGMYLTNILHIEEGNPDFLPRAENLINFAKRRKVAEITGEIQQYQNQPYCLTLVPKIRHLLENLNPFSDCNDTQISNYLYEKSLEIEPRGCKQPNKFPRKWPESRLKSPGIKPKSMILRSVPPALQSLQSIMSGSRTNIQDDNGPHSGDLTSINESSRGGTPSTPGTPLTPPQINDPVFASVIIGHNAGNNLSPGSPRFSRTFENLSRFGHASLPSSHGAVPPPLPPRTRRGDSYTGDLSPKVKQAPDAPQLPPRDVSPPPPLPPRRDISGINLARAHSVATLPSRYLPSHGAVAAPSSPSLNRQPSRQRNEFGSRTISEVEPFTRRHSSMDVPSSISPLSPGLFSPLPTIPAHGILYGTGTQLPPVPSPRSPSTIKGNVVPIVPPPPRRHSNTNGAGVQPLISESMENLVPLVPKSMARY